MKQLNELKINEASVDGTIVPMSSTTGNGAYFNCFWGYKYVDVGGGQMQNVYGFHCEAKESDNDDWGSGSGSGNNSSGSGSGSGSDTPVFQNKVAYAEDYGYWYGGTIGDISFGTEWDTAYGIYYDSMYGYQSTRAVNLSGSLAPDDPFFVYEENRKNFWKSFSVMRGILINNGGGVLRRALLNFPKNRTTTKLLTILKEKNPNPDKSISISNNYVYDYRNNLLGYISDDDRYGLYALV
ncbi:MAG: hypothetical protein LBV43_05390 [Prevotella sp.]|jgi:hypothetical protein|nr:hypothetical protein [Prevotella sp.]